MNATTAPAALFPLEPTAADAQAAIRDEFAFFGDWSERYQYLQNEQARFTPAPVPHWLDPTTPQLPPQGAMPGDPGVPTPGPAPAPPHPLEPFLPKKAGEPAR